ncbi:NIPSNAP family protein [Ramlibacter tataouinensis]|uniref:NIPSNAP domain-containing protein n=1 Tax=Ramlibacter tataouinensis (strain ATCC BAA-407 / DSM 14655 / LMG 21543 / TTB310) TaxID=365046 RepID=F5Y5W9_RAMTT|nr:NIPSNAP family protein [Ramlibacter tataouinensis]AEG91473.1 Hypothetical protein Rta_04020 [Ramlibacter tataouinensis TTB310]
MSTAPGARDCAVIELRQYTLHPGRREALIELFDREFVETQEAVGMRVLGQFRDLDDPDRFTWLRGFADMRARRRGLEAFYGGPVWAAHRDAANATMADSDNVLLLRPARSGSAWTRERPRPAAGAGGCAPGLLDGTVFALREPASPALLDLVCGRAAQVLREGGALDVGWYTNEPAPNDFPRLPVREKEQVLLGLALFADAPAFDAFVRAGRWQREIAPALQPCLAAAPETRRLCPTARSALRAG